MSKHRKFQVLRCRRWRCQLWQRVQLKMGLKYHPRAAGGLFIHSLHRGSLCLGTFSGSLQRGSHTPWQVELEESTPCQWVVGSLEHLSITSAKVRLLIAPMAEPGATPNLLTKT